MLFWKLGFRNIFRNKRRTLITSVVIGMGLTSLILTDAVMLGMNQSMIRTLTSVFLGEGKIQSQKFLETQEPEQTLKNYTQIIKKLKSDPDIESYTSRLTSFSMLSSAYNVINVGLVGIEPDKERLVSKIHKSIIEGETLINNRDILIGKKLAELLEVSLGEKIVASVAQAHTGEMSQELFFIKGIFKFNSREMDSSIAFVKLEAAQRILNLKNQAHEVVIQFKGDAKPGFLKKYSDSLNKSKTWKEISPAMASAVDMSGMSIAIISFVLFVIVLLSVANTLLMSLYERIFEFGIMKALGTRPVNLVKIIVYESIGLTITGCFLGALILAPLIYFLKVHGLDYTGLEMGEVTFNEPIYGYFYLEQFIKYPLFILSFVLAATIYPILHVLKIKPSEALRRSL